MEILSFIVIAQLVVSLYLSWKVWTLEDDSSSHYNMIGYILTETGLGEKALKAASKDE
jgi:hypothetical protein